ncbi:MULTISPECIES: glycosyltransferase family 2 protein [Xanthomonas]|uniref:glycosyltransferase family 2 protein n=1 Tax=Xanthomonas TaxID=338 RepID=UPI0022588F8A|nr:MULTISPECIES: glycosyltransferase family 2 protein [Xanthomonas]MCW0392669.1 putative glycosyltransferase [Xanthomonas sacchari]MDY4282481.1 glycosyltransferase family 2 protein [Xanthomonas sp. LF06-19]
MTASPESKRLISLVVPAFNEEDGINQTLARIEALVVGSDYAWQVVVVNDGSSDRTWEQLLGYRPANFSLKLVDLSRNFGKEAALSAGLEVADGEAVVPMDADLQDPPELVFQMLEHWRRGSDVVLARRADRSADSMSKRTTASMFYRMINKISDIDIPENVGDFRLMDRRVVDVLNRMPENRRFMKGLFAWAGFRTSVIDYVRPERNAGITKFNWIRLVNLAIEGITSFSTAPLRLATLTGCLAAIGSLLFACYITVRTVVNGVEVPGYASLVVIITFMSAIQLMALGVIGEYVGRTYLESKRRPAYVLRDVISVQGYCESEIR